MSHPGGQPPTLGPTPAAPSLSRRHPYFFAEVQNPSTPQLVASLVLPRRSSLLPVVPSVAAAAVPASGTRWPLAAERVIYILGGSRSDDDGEHIEKPDCSPVVHTPGLFRCWRELCGSVLRRPARL